MLECWSAGVKNAGVKNAGVLECWSEKSWKLPPPRPPDSGGALHPAPAWRAWGPAWGPGGVDRFYSSSLSPGPTVRSGPKMGFLPPPRGKPFTAGFSPGRYFQRSYLPKMGFLPPGKNPIFPGEDLAFKKRPTTIPNVFRNTNPSYFPSVLVYNC